MAKSQEEKAKEAEGKAKAVAEAKAEADKIKAEEKAKKVTSASVYSEKDIFVRKYTEEHSDKDKTFVEKAKGYAKKVGGTVKLA